MTVIQDDAVQAATCNCHPAAGCIQDEEQQQQAAGRIAKQLTGVSIDEASVTPLQAASHTLQAHTCKRQTENGASGLDLLQVFNTSLHSCMRILPPPQNPPQPPTPVSCSFPRSHFVFYLYSLEALPILGGKRSTPQWAIAPPS